MHAKENEHRFKSETNSAWLCLKLLFTQSYLTVISHSACCKWLTALFLSLHHSSPCWLGLFVILTVFVTSVMSCKQLRANCAPPLPGGLPASQSACVFSPIKPHCCIIIAGLCLCSPQLPGYPATQQHLLKVRRVKQELTSGMSVPPISVRNEEVKQSENKQCAITNNLFLLLYSMCSLFSLQNTQITAHFLFYTPVLASILPSLASCLR